MTARFLHATLVATLVFIFVLVLQADASRVDELRSRIEARNDSIQELENEIARYEDDLAEIGGESQTLENAIRSFNLTIQKLDADIALTRERIRTAQLSIQGLGISIAEQEEHILDNTNTLAETMRAIQEADTQTFAERILGRDRISRFWEDVETLQRFQIIVREKLGELRVTKEALVQNRESALRKAHELEAFRGTLAGQREVAADNREQKDELLDVTKRKEANYKELLEEARVRKENFEDELLRMEQELQIELDPERIPGAQDGILAWPLDSIYVTQFFGNTPFSRAGGLGIYNGRGHNGMDFRASVGTAVKAVLSGDVVGVGNTDDVAGCFSFGKWVMLEHDNGLSTLYAHLSHVKVNTGQRIITGDVIGLSGNTGASTGPHLHLGVYATQGARIQKFTNSQNCQNATIPIADLDAYLNPLSYLPSLNGRVVLN